MVSQVYCYHHEPYAMMTPADRRRALHVAIAAELGGVENGHNLLILLALSYHFATMDSLQ